MKVVKARSFNPQQILKKINVSYIRYGLDFINLRWTVNIKPSILIYHANCKTMHNCIVSLTNIQLGNLTNLRSNIKMVD